jgi:hypothetical protein
VDVWGKGRYIPTEGMAMEQRSVRRVVPGEPLPARLRTGVKARVLDLSPRGVQVEVSVPLPIRSRVEVVFRADQGDIPVRATVRRCRVHGRQGQGAPQGVLLFRAGLEFERPAPGLLSALGVEVGLKTGGETRIRSGPGEPES